MKKILYLLLFFVFLGNVNAKSFEFSIENKAVQWAGGSVGIKYEFSHFNIMYITQSDMDAGKSPRYLNALQFGLGPNMWLVFDAKRKIILADVNSNEKVYITILVAIKKVKNKIRQEVKTLWGQGVGLKEILDGDNVIIRAYDSSYDKNGVRYQDTSFKCVLPGKWDSTIK